MKKKKITSETVYLFLALLGTTVLFFDILFRKGSGLILVVSISMVIVYFVVSHLFISRLVDDLWRHLSPLRMPERFTVTLGDIDRIIYAFSFALRNYIFIGVWLGIKVASRLIGLSESPRQVKKISEGEIRNVHLIGNALSLLLGIVGGILIKSFLVRFNIDGMYTSFGAVLRNLSRE